MPRHRQNFSNRFNRTTVIGALNNESHSTTTSSTTTLQAPSSQLLQSTPDSIENQQLSIKQPSSSQESLSSPSSSNTGTNRNKFICQICNEHLILPLFLNCRHMFCLCCIEKFIAKALPKRKRGRPPTLSHVPTRRARCPTCDTPITHRAELPDQFVHLIDNLLNDEERKRQQLLMKERRDDHKMHLHHLRRDQEKQTALSVRHMSRLRENGIRLNNVIGGQEVQAMMPRNFRP